MAKNKTTPKPHVRESTFPKRTSKPRSFPVSADDGALRVRFNRIDIDGPWCLSKITNEHLRKLLDRLSSLETMGYSQVFAPGSQEGKEYPLEGIIKEAQDHLVELRFDDEPVIARLRVGGKERLYGFAPKGGPDFYALWWDPEHEICPSAKKHT